MASTGGISRWFPGIVIVLAAWLALFPVTSVDAYYHLAVGKRILEERSIPTRGVGSATFGSAPWHDNEWGFQVIVAAVAGTDRDEAGALVLSPAGTVTLIALRALLLALCLGWVSCALRRKGVEPTLRALSLWLVAFLTFGNLFWAVRPQIVSYALFAFLLCLLEVDRSGRRWAFPAMLGVVALWANVHGAFPVGVVLVACEAVGNLWDGRSDEAMRRRGLRLAAIALAMPLAAACNPNGFDQVLHPLRYMLEPEIHAGNAEWLPPDFVHLPLLLVTAAWAGISWWAAGRGDSGTAIRILVFFALLTTALRHLPFTAMVLVAAASPAASASSRRGGWRAWLDPISAAGGSSPRRRLVAFALLAAGIVGLSGAKFIHPVPRFEESPVRPMPEAEVRFLLRNRVEGTGFNAYRFGGFLMFRMYPRETVFMDGRNDLYGMFRHTVYNPVLRAEPGWEKLWDEAVARFDVRWVLIDSTDPLAERLAGRPDWIRREAGEPDGGIVLFLRERARGPSGSGREVE